MPCIYWDHGRPLWTSDRSPGGVRAASRASRYISEKPPPLRDDLSRLPSADPAATSQRPASVAAQPIALCGRCQRWPSPTVAGSAEGFGIEGSRVAASCIAIGPYFKLFARARGTLWPRAGLDSSLHPPVYPSKIQNQTTSPSIPPPPNPISGQYAMSLHVALHECIVALPLRRAPPPAVP